jgi:hypothetical protein
MDSAAHTAEADGQQCERAHGEGTQYPHEGENLSGRACNAVYVGICMDLHLKLVDCSVNVTTEITVRKR